MSSRNPYYSLNLRRNPFGELTRQEWTDVAVTQIADIRSRLERPGVAIQLLANKGRGKTTHLLALANNLPNAVYFRASRDPAPSRGQILLMDEAQSLWPWQRARVAKRFPSLAYSTHHDLSLEFRLLGYTVEPFYVQTTSLALLREIVDRRIAKAHYGVKPPPIIEYDRLNTLQARFNDDIRSIFDELYVYIHNLASSNV